MDITGPFGIFFAIVLPVLLLLAITFSLLASNKVQVDAGQWKVMQNLSGQFRAFGPGTVITAPGWKEVPSGTIPTTVQVKSVAKDSVNSADQIPFLTGYRMNWVYGRPYREIPGHADWYEFAVADPLSTTSVREDMVIRLATSVQSGQFEDQVNSDVKGAWEASLGSISAKEIAEITTINKGNGISLPKDVGVPCTVSTVKSKAELYGSLAHEAMLRANRILMPKGIGITDIVVTNCDYQDKEVKNARMAKIRTELLIQAATAAITTDPQLEQLDPAVRLAIGTDAFEDIVGKRAKVDVAKVWANTINKLASSLSKGALKGAIHIEVKNNKIGGSK
jgi:hypothetical protein